MGSVMKEKLHIELRMKKVLVRVCIRRAECVLDERCHKLASHFSLHCKSFWVCLEI